MKLKLKITEEKREKNNRWFNVARIVKNTVCWVLIGVLALSMLVFLITKMNGGTPSVFGYTIQRISSGSMEPELMVGDVILSKEIDDVNSLKAGDIITFQGGAEFNYNRVTHRVISAPHMIEGESVLQTQGDANDVADSEITADKVLSRFVVKINVLSGLYNLFLSPWGLIIFVGLLLIVFFEEVVNIVRIITGDYPDEDEESISEIIERIKREEAEKEVSEQKKKDKKQDKKDEKKKKEKSKKNKKTKKKKRKKRK